MAKRPEQSAKLIAPGIAQSSGWYGQASGYTQVSGTSVWPYSTNVVWQDTSSNATYCSASQALSATG